MILVLIYTCILYILFCIKHFLFLFILFFTNQTEVRGQYSAVELTNVSGAIYSYQKRASRIIA